MAAPPASYELVQLNRSPHVGLCDDQRTHQAGECVNFDVLSEEVVLYIFSFLSCYELLAASEVNMRWYRLANDNGLWRSIYRRDFKHVEKTQQQQQEHPPDEPSRAGTSISIAIIGQSNTDQKVSDQEGGSSESSQDSASDDTDASLPAEPIAESFLANVVALSPSSTTSAFFSSSAGPATPRACSANHRTPESWKLTYLRRLGRERRRAEHKQSIAQQAQLITLARQHQLRVATRKAVLSALGLFIALLGTCLLYFRVAGYVSAGRNWHYTTPVGGGVLFEGLAFAIASPTRGEKAAWGVAAAAAATCVVMVGFAFDDEVDFAYAIVVAAMAVVAAEVATVQQWGRARRWFAVHAQHRVLNLALLATNSRGTFTAHSALQSYLWVGTAMPFAVLVLLYYRGATQGSLSGEVDNMFAVCAPVFVHTFVMVVAGVVTARLSVNGRVPRVLCVVITRRACAAVCVCISLVLFAMRLELSSSISYWYVFLPLFMLELLAVWTQWNRLQGRHPVQLHYPLVL